MKLDPIIGEMYLQLPKNFVSVRVTGWLFIVILKDTLWSGGPVSADDVLLHNWLHIGTLIWGLFF